MLYKVVNRATGAQHRYKRHHASQMWSESLFPVNWRVYIDQSSLLLLTGDQIAVEAISKLLLPALGPYCVTYKILKTIFIAQNRNCKNISADRAALTSTDTHPQANITDDEHNQWLS